LAILGQKYLIGLKIHSQSNQKLLPIFVSKGQRVKQSKKEQKIKLLPLNVSIGQG
jgi:hypothetical protein